MTRSTKRQQGTLCECSEASLKVKCEIEYASIKLHLNEILRLLIQEENSYSQRLDCKVFGILD